MRKAKKKAWSGRDRNVRFGNGSESQETISSAVCSWLKRILRDVTTKSSFLFQPPPLKRKISDKDASHLLFSLTYGVHA